MFRRRGENLHTIYIFLFLNVAFFLLEYQDQAKFARLFSFDRASFLSGQFWRVVTYQFSHALPGWTMPIYIVFFFTLVLMYMFGAPLEEEWGSANFIGFFLVSTIATAFVGGWLGVGLLGSYFVRSTLLFVYASVFRDQTFFLFAIIPIRVRWLAYIAAGMLVYGAMIGGAANVPVLAGAVAGYVYYLLHRAPVPVVDPRQEKANAPKTTSSDMTAVRNAARFVAVKKALANHSDADIDRLIAQNERDMVQGVNVCPPADYKPEHNDGYCIRCEGFAECSARYLRLNRTQAPDAPPVLGTHSFGGAGEPPPP